MAGAPYRTAAPALLAEAFRWEETRKVRKNATVSLFGAIYCVPEHLAGATVELVFDRSTWGCWRSAAATRPRAWPSPW